MSGRRPRRKLVPPVETITVRGSQHPKKLLVQSVLFGHLDNDGTVTTNSVLDLATRPCSGAAPFPDIDIGETSNDGYIDSLDVSNSSLSNSPSKTFDSLSEIPNETSAEVVPGFFDIDSEDEIINIGDRNAPKRPHQVCCILNLQGCLSECAVSGEI
jgi:hypothetical protein